MELYAGLDVSLETTALCVVDREGAIILESVVTTDPDAIADRLRPHAPHLRRIGLEAGPLSEWLVRGLKDASAQRHPDGNPACPRRALGNNRQD